MQNKNLLQPKLWPKVQFAEKGVRLTYNVDNNYNVDHNYNVDNSYNATDTWKCDHLSSAEISNWAKKTFIYHSTRNMPLKYHLNGTCANVSC